ncbi:hypothetical protein FKG94_17290 [Exilibacterium tricleocarpae]|uniref:Uncharacterized protein n=1 Tax=Exilibacterium tricleocarpae TaxID=2591008 RepID=A0A545T8B0_9GAMM|nr:hypothetical protein [Exilibacterium tricleocarpae]TQV73456.1 hypothetical protein FKG94_17290 [Exilibacterium tricleocarpae]
MHYVQTHTVNAGLLRSLVARVKDTAAKDPAAKTRSGEVAAENRSARGRETGAPANVSIDLAGDDWAYAKSNN